MKKVFHIVILFSTIILMLTLTSCKKKINISWMDETGKLIETTQVKKGEVPTHSYTPKEGYRFDGWASNLNAEVLPSLPAATKDATYYAIISKLTDYFTITFNSKGGSNVASITKEKMSVVNEPTKPTYNGYRFIGWSKNENGSDRVSWPLTLEEDITLYAIWVKQVTITFDSKGGSKVDSITGDYQTSINEPTKPTYEGYRFMGWSKKENSSEIVSWPLTLEEDTTLYAIWNEKVDIKQYLASLLNGFNLNPYEYIPESMRAEYSQNLVDKDFASPDYTNFVNVSDIKYGGFGEQWHMIIDNIEQSKNFFNVLSTVEALATTSITAFNNYIDSNPSDTANYQFRNGIYNVTINFDGTIIFYVLDYEATLPIFGAQTIQIALSYNIENSERTGRIQIGDANALKYEVQENAYKFAIRYLGVRRAYFEISKDENNNIQGSIFEFLGVDDVAQMKSSAIFYTDGTYLSAVGNKAGGLLGFKGYINELYSLETGHLLGYEVRETLSSLVYNTLWFNLNDMGGINNIKVLDEKNDSNNNTIYINNSDTPFAIKKVGGISGKMLSRRFDIEMRTQYYYYYDETNEKYVEVATKVPMFFVQEENLNTLVSDVLDSNKVNILVNLDSQILTKIQKDYDELIDVFISVQEEMTYEAILDYIGKAYNFA